jgi:hypothetical protein
MRFKRECFEIGRTVLEEEVFAETEFVNHIWRNLEKGTEIRWNLARSNS